MPGGIGNLVQTLKQKITGAGAGEAAGAPAAERVVQIDVGCTPEPGPAAAPLLFMNDNVAFLVFNAVRTGGGGGPRGGERALVELRRCAATRFGYPSDAALARHPLFDKGLGHFGVFEVFDSAWVRQLRDQHRATGAPDGANAPGASPRHFAFTFHDSTLECVADELVVVLTRDRLDEIIAGILPLMRDG
jgi:hypothetical protein